LIHSEETLSTLQFANRAKAIKNKPIVNEVLDEQAMLKRLQKEVITLRNQVDSLKSSDNSITLEQLQMLQHEKQQVYIYRESCDVTANIE
jgi:uncharacterized protein YlxW (UPF0749 family)